jgi:hypothetical protein
MNCAAKRSERLFVVQRCAVKDCGALTRNRYCDRCEEEIEALHEIAAARDDRRERRAQLLYAAAIAFELLCARVRRQLAPAKLLRWGRFLLWYLLVTAVLTAVVIL